MSADLVQILVWQAERIRQLETQVYVDKLTTIGNRAAFDRALAHDWDQWRKDHQDFALLYLDGNGIKHINDSFGHDVGDRFIQAIAGCIRCYDQSFRLGGDEFAVILSAESESIPAITQRIHHRVFVAEQRLKSQLGPQAHLSAAIGWAMASTVADPEQLKHRADADMYAKKAVCKQYVQPPKLAYG